jgi:hypothetical protein
MRPEKRQLPRLDSFVARAVPADDLFDRVLAELTLWTKN